ncbi:transcriptional regulator, TetR family [Kordiimonas lacus]|uniref:Transcriptional regulator, TetR family n=1 Tax=Kordiimonas lacus TaxID=637679 RepID=A0A1G7D5E9_9PROT|nr:transcriptional regulator, TetR family [Kordiimonas lacus]
MSKRKYQMTRRAQAQEETKGRIVDAIIALHERVGPKATTVTAIAEEAGVQRLTVYKYFPDEEAQLKACTSRWTDQNPRPSAEEWMGYDDLISRCEAALSSLYAYYGRTAPMWHQTYRDKDDVPPLANALEGFEGFLADVSKDILAVAEHVTPELQATVAHLLAFPTWASLNQACNSDEQMLALVIQWVRAVAKGQG